MDGKLELLVVNRAKPREFRGDVNALLQDPSFVRHWKPLVVGPFDSGADLIACLQLSECPHHPKTSGLRKILAAIPAETSDGMSSQIRSEPCKRCAAAQNMLGGNDKVALVLRNIKLPWRLRLQWDQELVSAACARMEKDHIYLELVPVEELEPELKMLRELSCGSEHL
jgi:hypothetical protein